MELYHLHTIFTADIQIPAGYGRWDQRSSIDNPSNACAEAMAIFLYCFSACLRVNSSSEGPVLHSCVNLHCRRAAARNVSEVCVRTHPCEGECMCRVFCLSHLRAVSVTRCLFNRAETHSSGAMGKQVTSDKTLLMASD